MPLWWVLTASAGPGTVILGMHDGARPSRSAVEAAGGVLRRCFASSSVCLVEGGDPAELAGIPGVRSAEWDAQLSLATVGTVPVTTQCPDPWGLIALHAQASWSEVCGVGAPVVAIADSGFRVTHVDLAGRIAGGWDYGDEDPDPEVSPFSGTPAHGTFIAGLIAGVRDDFGVTGVVPDGSLFLQKVADSDGALFYSYAIAAMDDLVLNHPEVGVLSYSLSGSSAPDGFRAAVQALRSADIVVVTAAANCPAPNCADADNDVFPQYPASYPFRHLVAVASLQPDGTLDPQSHYGAASVDLAAPGADLCSLGVASDTDTTVASGTSYAAPMVAGVAALVREAWPRLTAPEVVEVLRRSCTPRPGLADRLVCGGAVDAEAALHTPVIDLPQPDGVVVDGRLDWTLPVRSLGASGALHVIVMHPDWLVVEGADVVRFVAGDVLALPDGDWTAEASGSRVVLPLAREGGADPVVALRASGEGAGTLSVFAVATGLRDRGWRSPTAEQTAAGQWTVDVTGTPAPEADTDGPVLPTTPQPETPSGCGCEAGGPVRGLWWGLFAVAALRGRISVELRPTDMG